MVYSSETHSDAFQVSTSSPLLLLQLRASLTAVTEQTWCKEDTPISKGTGANDSAGPPPFILGCSDALDKGENVKTPTLKSVQAAHDPAPRASSTGVVFAPILWNDLEFQGLSAGETTARAASLL